MTRWWSTSPSSRVPTSTPADREPARTDDQAKKRFLRVLSKSLSAVAKEPIWRIAPLEDGGFSAFTVPPVVPLKTSDGNRVFLRSTINFGYVDHPKYEGERKVSTNFYAHTVGTTEELKPQLYSWEWNSANPTCPHVHVRRADPGYAGLGKLHIPTGRVFFEHVLLFVIEEHDVTPSRDDWHDVLGESLHRVSTYSTWGGGLPP